MLGFIKNKAIAAGAVLIGGLAVAAFGFSNVVATLYPVIGAIGLLYIACNCWFLIRTRAKHKVKTKLRKVKKAVKRAKRSA